MFKNNNGLYNKAKIFFFLFAFFNFKTTHLDEKEDAQ